MYLDVLRSGNDMKRNYYYTPYNFGSRLAFNRWFDGSSANKQKRFNALFKPTLGSNPNLDASRGLWMNTLLNPG